MIELVTVSYGEYTPSMGAPVRTSLGTPRWFPHPLPLAWENVMPDRWMLGIEDEAEYRRAYWEKLNRVGYETLLGDVEFLVDAWERVDGRRPDRLALLCYEKLSKPGNWCHRTMFGQWWTDQSGSYVGEFGAMPLDLDPEDPCLF